MNQKIFSITIIALVLANGLSDALFLINKPTKSIQVPQDLIDKLSSTIKPVTLETAEDLLAKVLEDPKAKDLPISVKNLINEYLEAVKQIAALKELILGGLEEGKQLLIDDPQGALDLIKKIAEKIILASYREFTSILNVHGAVLEDIGEGISDALKRALALMQCNASSAVSGIRSMSALMEQVLNDGGTGFDDAIKKVREILDNVDSVIAGNLLKAVTIVLKGLSDPNQGEAISTKAVGSIDIPEAQDAINKITSLTGTITDKILGLGLNDIIKGLSASVADVAIALTKNKEALKGVAELDSVDVAVEKIPGILHNLEKDIYEAIAEAYLPVAESAPKLGNKSLDIVTDMYEAIGRAKSDLYFAIKQAMKQAELKPDGKAISEIVLGVENILEDAARVFCKKFVDISRTAVNIIKPVLASIRPEIKLSLL